MKLGRCYLEQRECFFKAEMQKHCKKKSKNQGMLFEWCDSRIFFPPICCCCLSIVINTASSEGGSSASVKH